MPKNKKPAWLTYPDGSYQWLPVGCLNAPVFKLPDNRIFSTVNKYASITNPDTIIGKGGVTSVKNSPGNYSSNWMHSSEMANSGKPTSSELNPDGSRVYPYNDHYLTRDDMRLVAGQARLYALEADEFFEGQYFMDPSSPLPRYYYEKRKEMYDAAGKVYTSIGSYGAPTQINIERWNFLNGGAEVLPNTVQMYKNWIQTQAGAQSSCSYFSMYSDRLIGANIKNYMDRPDFGVQFYGKKFAMEVMNKGLGRSGGIGPGVCVYLDWGKFEPINNPLNNAFFVERKLTNPEGILAYPTHTQMDYDLQVAGIYKIGFEIGSGYVAFDEPDVFGTNPNNVRPYGAIWTPKVPGTIPNYVNSEYYPFEPYRWVDAGYEAAYYYYLTSRTEGQKWNYGRFSLDNGNSWIEPTSDGSDTLDNASAFDGPFTETGRRGRLDFTYRVKGNALDFSLFDPSRRKGTYENVLLEPLPGKRFSVNLEGSKLETYNETI